MNKKVVIPQLLIALYCLWHGKVLWEWNMPHPHHKMMLVAFLLWASPSLFALYQARGKETVTQLSYLAVLSTTIGVLGSLNVLKQIGLGLAIAGLHTSGIAAGVVVLTFPCWTTAYGWILGPTLGDFLPVSRLMLAVIPLIAWGVILKTRRVGAKI